MKPILADAEHDYAITTQAKAVFELGRLHIKKALKTELINSGRYAPIPTFYADLTDGNRDALKKFNVHPGFAKELSDCKVVFASSEKFLQKNKYESFVFVIAFFDPDRSKRKNDWDGFFNQQGISLLPTVTLYCPYTPPKRTEFGFLQVKDVADALVSGMNVYTQKIKDVFVHEFGHNYNFLQWKEKNKGKVPKVKYAGAPPKPPTPEGYKDPAYLKQYEAYVNDPQEVNSRYLEWIKAIQDSFTRLLRIKDSDYDIRKAFPTFHDFWDFYWTTPGFVPEALRVWANDKTIKKLTRRMSNFYTFLVENPVSNPREVEQFIQKSMEVDYNAPAY